LYAELVEVDEMIVMDVVAELDKMRIIKVVTEPEKTTKRERRDGRRRRERCTLTFGRYYRWNNRIQKAPSDSIVLLLL